MILKLVEQISSIQISRLGMDGDRINFRHNWGQREDLLGFRLSQSILVSLPLMDPALNIFDKGWRVGEVVWGAETLNQDSVQFVLASLPLLGTSLSKLKVDLLNLNLPNH